jgi:hypothetical protein
VTATNRSRPPCATHRDPSHGAAGICPALLAIGIFSCGYFGGLSHPTTGDDGGGTDGYQSFFIAEQNSYINAVAPCYQTNDLQVLGVELEKILKAKQWKGLHADEDCSGTKCARPSDFVEANKTHGPELKGLAGQDHVWADGSTLAVYAGHSAQDHLVFGASESAPNGNVCELRFSLEHTQLGILAGKRARLAMFLSSCVGYMDEAAGPGILNENDFFNGLGKNNSWIYMAFFDEARISTYRPKMFVECVDGSKGYGAYNNHCWQDTMWFYTPDYKSQPIFISTGRSDESLTELNKRHEESNFLTGAHLPPTRTTPFNWSTDNMYWVATWNDGIPNNEDPIPSECLDYLP